MATYVMHLSPEPGIQHADVYQDDADRNKHTALIHEISKEEQLPLEQVVVCYESTLQDLRSQACVQDFLDVFVARRVRERFRERPY
jgi:hypothetical protein